ncbi:uncharacterized protein METZ01_LOCUS429457, partial [marine metagenome]
MPRTKRPCPGRQWRYWALGWEGMPMKKAIAESKVCLRAITIYCALIL